MQRDFERVDFFLPRNSNCKTQLASKWAGRQDSQGINFSLLQRSLPADVYILAASVFKGLQAVRSQDCPNFRKISFKIY